MMTFEDVVPGERAAKSIFAVRFFLQSEPK